MRLMIVRDTVVYDCVLSLVANSPYCGGSEGTTLSVKAMDDSPGFRYYVNP